MSIDGGYAVDSKGQDHSQFDGGLVDDLLYMKRRASRRSLLKYLSASALLIGCGAAGSNSTTTGSSTGNTTNPGTSGSAGGVDAAGSSCESIPAETAGPYPGDGSNGPNALVSSGIVRSDLTSSFGAYSGVASGIPLLVELTLLNGSCQPLANHALYLWHCDRAGKYSLYTVSNQNYLRGVQATNTSGTVTFQTIFPGCYDGRSPHMHFEIFSSVASATSAKGRLHTSQLAFPADICSEVYKTTGYESSLQNFARTSHSTDNVFRDGVTLQLASVSGNVQEGFLAALTLAI